MTPGWESVNQWLAENHALVPDGEGWRDKDCPMDHIPEPCPVCKALAKARADERAAIHKALDAEKPRWEAEIRADEQRGMYARYMVDREAWEAEVRERIAQAIEVVGGCDCFDHASDADHFAAIARGESDG